MKNIIIILVLSVFITSAKAQYNPESLNLNIGTSFFEPSSLTLTSGNFSYIPPVVVNIQKGLFPSGSYWTKLISVGGSIMYDLDVYKWTSLNINYYDRNSYLKIGGVGSYHITPILQDYAGWGEGFDKIDIYISIYFGLSMDTYTTNYNWNYTTNSYEKKIDHSVFPYTGEVLGAKYYFSENFGVYGEVGYGGNPGYITLGFTANF